MEFLIEESIISRNFKIYMISRKVILTGSFGVGKTSLFRRFISGTFSEKYITTIGVKVDKKVVEVHGQEVSILLWDIAGEVSQDKVPKSFFSQRSQIFTFPFIPNFLNQLNCYFFFILNKESYLQIFRIWNFRGSNIMSIFALKLF